MKGNKKAEEQNVIVAAILILAFIIIAVIIISKISEVAGTASEKETCKQSIIMYSTLALGGKPLTDSIKCPTKYLSLSSSKSNLEIQKTIANEMYDCWDNFGQGKLELFDTKNENFCVVCSSVSFSGAQKEISGFGGFLAAQKIPGKDETYLEFLGQNFEDYDLLKSQAESPDNTFKIDTSEQYAVMFVYAKQARMSTIAKIGIGAGAAAAGVIGIALIASGVGAPIGIAGIAFIAKTAAVAAAVGGYGGSKAGADASEWQASVMLVQTDEITGIGCTNIPKNK
jgi:hypothetical protein